MPVSPGAFVYPGAFSQVPTLNERSPGDQPLLSLRPNINRDAVSGVTGTLGGVQSTLLHRNSTSVATVICGASSQTKCPASSTIDSCDPGISAWKRSAIFGVEKRSCPPQMISTGTPSRASAPSYGIHRQGRLLSDRKPEHHHLHRNRHSGKLHRRIALFSPHLHHRSEIGRASCRERV